MPGESFDPNYAHQELEYHKNDWPPGTMIRFIGNELRYSLTDQKAKEDVALIVGDTMLILGWDVYQPKINLDTLVEPTLERPSGDVFLLPKNALRVWHMKLQRKLWLIYELDEMLNGALEILR